MKTIPLDSLIVCGLAAWRYAHFVISDVLAQPIKDKILDAYEKSAFRRKSRSEKKIEKLWLEQIEFQELLDRADMEQDFKAADFFEERVQDLEEKIRNTEPKRTLNQNLWIKLTILLGCIYCLTFWTALLNYTPFTWINNIGAIWGLATLIGLSHDALFTEPETE